MLAGSSVLKCFLPQSVSLDFGSAGLLPVCLAAAAQLGGESLLPKSICYVSIRDVFSPRRKKKCYKVFF